MTEYRYNWQAEPEGFLKWFLPTVVSAQNQAKFEELSEATDRFHDVRVTIQINGIEVDARKFFEGCERTLEASARAEARDMLNELGDFEEVYDVLRDLRVHLRAEILNRLSRAGIELPGEPW